MAAVLLVYEQIVEHYLDKIRNGELKPGDYLGTEEQTAETFDISRGTVRKAYGVMHELGYIVRKRGKGTRIAEDIFDKISRFKLGVSDEVKVIGVTLVDNSEYLLTIIKTLEAEIASLGWKMELKFNNNIEKERYCIESLISMNVDGIIIIPFRSAYNSFSFKNFCKLTDSKIPFVMIGKPPMGIMCDAVYTEDYMASMSIVEELYSRGCKTFIHVTDSLADNMVYHDRLCGYELGSKKCGQNNMHIFDIRSTTFEAELTDFFISHKEKLGVNLYSDKLLSKAYDILQSCGRKYGMDILTIGFNENAHVKSFGLKRLCMVIPKEEIAKTSMQLLCRRFKKENVCGFAHRIFSAQLMTDDE